MLVFNDRDKIVFTGDSITDADRGRPVGEGLWAGVGNGYVRLIDTFLNVCYPENLYHIMNTANNGATSRDMLTRWEKDVLELTPDWVSLCIGGNDVWRQFDTPQCPNQHVYIDEYKDNLTKIAEMTVSKVKGMFFMTPYLIEANSQDPLRVEMERYGKAMKEVAAKFDITCIDLQEVFSDYLRYRHSSFLMWDRVHPGWIGNMLIARRFLKEVGFDRQIIV